MIEKVQIAAIILGSLFLIASISWLIWSSLSPSAKWQRQDLLFQICYGMYGFMDIVCIGKGGLLKNAQAGLKIASAIDELYKNISQRCSRRREREPQRDALCNEGSSEESGMQQHKNILINIGCIMQGQTNTVMKNMNSARILLAVKVRRELKKQKVN